MHGATYSSACSSALSSSSSSSSPSSSLRRISVALETVAQELPSGTLLLLLLELLLMLPMLPPSIQAITRRSGTL